MMDRLNDGKKLVLITGHRRKILGMDLLVCVKR